MNTKLKKIIFLKELVDEIVKIRELKRKIIVVGGCFDIFHYGHLSFLKKAKEQGGFLIILLESDEFITKKKKRQPIHHQDQRAEILASLTDVDLVVKLPLLKEDKDYEKIVAVIRPSVIAVTSGDRKLKKKKYLAQKYKAELKIVFHRLKDFSTRVIIKKLKLF